MHSSDQFTTERKSNYRGPTDADEEQEEEFAGILFLLSLVMRSVDARSIDALSLGARSIDARSLLVPLFLAALLMTF